MKHPDPSSRLRDLCLAVPTYVAAKILGRVRGYGVGRLPWCRAALLRAGVFPLANHYYDPRFDYRGTAAERNPRNLPGIDFDWKGQRRFLEALDRADELKEGIPEGLHGLRYDPANSTFGPGDAETWYQVVRHRKPSTILEIGSGNSNLAASAALRRNREEDAAYRCRHICVEPYEMPWLESAGVEILRQRVEAVDGSLFAALRPGDILFIDSSHMIRPDGDVLFEYLTLLPTLPKGVLVHVHDIFSPRDYPLAWLAEDVRFWNEQYLLEAFLTGNPEWKVRAALNHWHWEDFSVLSRVSPGLRRESPPGSFYIERE